MIALNETNEYAAEVAFTLFSGLTPITGWSFTLGEVRIKLPGGSWTDVAVNKIQEKGFGRYVARLTAAQCTTAGDVYIKAIVAGAQNYYGSDVIGTLGGDISVAGTGSLNFFLPDATDPFLNPPLTEHTFVLGEVKICLPDATYVNVALADIEEIGFGLYRVNLDATDTAKRGKVFVYASVTGYQAFEGYSTILGVGVVEEEGEDPGDPVPVPIVFGDEEYHDQLVDALNRLPQQFRSGDLIYKSGLTLAAILAD